MINDLTNSPAFWDHFEELRTVLIKVIFIILCFTGAAFFFHKEILESLSSKIAQENSFVSEIKTHKIANNQESTIVFTLPKNSSVSSTEGSVIQINDSTYFIPPNSALIWQQQELLKPLFILSPIEGFSVSLKLSFWLGFVLSSPIWLFFILQFITPGLYAHEKAIIFPFLFLSFIFISLGLSLAFFVTIPLANAYLALFNNDIGTNLWSLSLYVDYTLVLLLANALAFEFLAILFILIHFNKITKEMMVSKRKFFILTAFIISAILTPPDILSQLLLAIPLTILYEVLIVYASFKKGVVKTLAYSDLNL